MNREKEIIKTSLVGILGNVLLVAAKSIIGFIAGSISIILDAVNNLTDALSSIITIIGTKLANRRPDKNHPYGHGRVEYITSAIIAFIILFAGGTAIYESVQSLIKKTVADYTYITIIIVSIAIIVKIFLGIFFIKRGKKLNSETLIASGKDAMFDSLLSTGTLVSVIVMMTSGVAIEGYVGLVIGVFILKGGFEVLKESASSIVGKRISKDVAVGIKNTVLSFKEVKGAYDLIVNDYGVDKYIGSIHIEVDDALTARDIHPLTRKISEVIYMKYHVLLTVGIYASNTYDDQVTLLRHDIKEILKKYPQVIQMHGFYVDSDTMSVSFDIIISMEEKNQAEIKESIYKEISTLHPEYNYFIIIDQDFSD